MKIEVIIGNLVNQPDIDVIVNSANANLRIGSGVAGAIHVAAGPRLEEYCRPFAPLELGSALITPGFKLPNPWVIHVRGAHYINHSEPERYMLFAMISMLNTARQNRLKTIAMPAIGTGVFKFPPKLAARITAKALVDFSKSSDAIELVRICVLNEEFRELYQSAVDQEIVGSHQELAESSLSAR